MTNEPFAYPYCSEAIRKSGQEAWEAAFEQELNGPKWTVIYSPDVCLLKRYTPGNRIKCTDGQTRACRRWIDMDRHRVFWCFANDHF